MNYLIAILCFCVLFSQGQFDQTQNSDIPICKYSYFVFLLVSASAKKINCYEMAEGDIEIENLDERLTCETSKMCVRKTISVLIFLQYQYTYTLACEDKLDKDDKEAVDKLTDKKGCTKIVGNNADGCITKTVKGKFVEFCCCDGNK